MRKFLLFLDQILSDSDLQLSDYISCHDSLEDAIAASSKHEYYKGAVALFDGSSFTVVAQADDLNESSLEFYNLKRIVRDWHTPYLGYLQHA